MKKSIHQIFAEVFEIPLSEVNDNLSKSSFEQWDSIMHLTLISEVELELDISFEPEEIEKIDTIKDLITLSSLKTEA